MKNRYMDAGMFILFLGWQCFNVLLDTLVNIFSEGYVYIAGLADSTIVQYMYI